jgi:hypothetical protein
LFSLRYLTRLEGMHGMVKSGLGIVLSVAIGREGDEKQQCRDQ